MTRTATAFLVAALVLVSSSPAFAQEEAGRSVEQLVEQAKTPQDHAELATYYHQKAEEARAEAQRHAKMAKAYAGGSMSMRESMKRHCESLAKEARAMANDYDELAKAHEQQGKK